MKVSEIYNILRYGSGGEYIIIIDSQVSNPDKCEEFILEIHSDIKLFYIVKPDNWEVIYDGR